MLLCDRPWTLNVISTKIRVKGGSTCLTVLASTLLSGTVVVNREGIHRLSALEMA